MALSEKEIEKIFKGVYEGSISIETLPVALSAFTFEEIISFVEKGFGELTSEAKITRMGSYDDNITAFSGAKTFQNVKDLNAGIFMPDGSKRPFKEFRDFAHSINSQYNDIWLKAEQDTAFGVSQSADKWIGIQDDKDTFPFLQYVTMGDQRVRPEHAEWNGIIRPVDDSFWDTHMPPNAFRCRCDVNKLAEGKSTSLRGVPKNEDEMFNVNPGKVDYIYNEEKHPYFKHTKSESAAFEKSQRWREQV
jgi:SPP1 gp7 family putative phage head morphogenesis protein